MDAQGNFAVAVPLAAGDNLLALTIASAGEVVTSADKQVFYDPNLATGGQRLLCNGFLVSPDGTRLYSRNERLDVQANVLLGNMPLSIVTGSSWSGAPIPGGPAIFPDGRRIYCCNSLQIIDTQDNTAVAPPISGSYLSDIALTPDESRILITSHSNGDGSLSAYDAATFESAGSNPSRSSSARPAGA